MKSMRWAFDIKSWHPSDNDIHLMTTYLTNDIKLSLGKFVYVKDIKARLINHLIKCCMTTLLCNEEEIKKVEMLTSTQGKPFLHGLSNPWYFNTSHEGSYVALVGSINFDVGVDIMSLSRFINDSILDLTKVNRFLKTMQKTMTLPEWNFINVADTKIKLENFLKLWCLKESFIKAKGDGIVSNDFGSIEFFIPNQNWHVNKMSFGPVMNLPKNQNHFAFQVGRLDETHLVAITYKSFNSFIELNNETNKFNFLTFEMIKGYLKYYPTKNQIDYEVATKMIEKFKIGN